MFYLARELCVTCDLLYWWHLWQGSKEVSQAQIVPCHAAPHGPGQQIEALVW